MSENFAGLIFIFQTNEEKKDFKEKIGNFGKKNAKSILANEAQYGKLYDGFFGEINEDTINPLQRKEALQTMFHLFSESNDLYVLFASNSAYVTNRNWGWESIEETAKLITSEISTVCVTIAYNAYDIFLLSVIQKNKIITKIIFGEAIDIYGVKEVPIDFAEFAKFTNVYNAQLEAYFLEKNAEKIIEMLSKYLKFDFNIFDSIDDMLNEKLCIQRNGYLELVWRE